MGHIAHLSSIGTIRGSRAVRGSCSKVAHVCWFSGGGRALGYLLGREGVRFFGMIGCEISIPDFQIRSVQEHKKCYNYLLLSVELLLNKALTELRQRGL